MIFLLDSCINITNIQIGSNWIFFFFLATGFLRTICTIKMGWLYNVSITCISTNQEFGRIGMEVVRGEEILLLVSIYILIR